MKAPKAKAESMSFGIHASSRSCYAAFPVHPRSPAACAPSGRRLRAARASFQRRWSACCGPTRPTVGQLRPIMAQILPDSLTKIARHWSNFVTVRPIGPKLAKHWPTSADVGRTWPVIPSLSGVARSVVAVRPVPERQRQHDFELQANRRSGCAGLRRVGHGAVAAAQVWVARAAAVAQCGSIAFRKRGDAQLGM